MVKVLDETGAAVACFQSNSGGVPPICMALDLTKPSPEWDDKLLTESRFYGNLVTIHIGGKPFAWLSGGSPSKTYTGNLMRMVDRTHCATSKLQD